MAIKTFNVFAQLKVGHWINVGSSIRFNYSGNVARVIGLTAKAAVVELHTNAGIVNKTVLCKHITHVCDTQEEAEHMRERGLAFAIRALKKEATLLRAIRKAQIVAAARAAASFGK